MKVIESRVNHVVQDDLQRIALAVFLGENCNDIKNPYDDYFEIGNREYLVIVGDEQATERAEEYVKELIDDVYMTKDMKDSWLSNYIDIDGAAEYAVSIDGRGHSLASYDGHENEVYFSDIDEYVFIYRTN